MFATLGTTDITSQVHRMPMMRMMHGVAHEMAQKESNHREYSSYYGRCAPTGVQPPSKVHEGEFHNATTFYTCMPSEMCRRRKFLEFDYDIRVNTNDVWRVQQDFDLTDTVRKKEWH